MQISDVTLREGDQQPGTSYSASQKVEAGRLLDRLGVDFVQAGFPITGETDREAISRLTDDVDAEVVGLARALPGDIDAAASAEADVVDIIVPSSEWQRPYVIGGSRAEILETAATAVETAQNHGLSVHLSLMDAFRSDVDTVTEYFEAFPDVSCITLADTVGARTPHSVTSFIESVTAVVDPSRVGGHFHNDLGVATANSLAAARSGIEKIDVSVAAIGERAGNTPLEEFVVAGTVDDDLAIDLKFDQLVPVCTKLLDLLNEPVASNKPVLGDRGFAHESGLHTAAMLEEPGAFEPFDPAQFGGERRLLFGVETGRGAARALIEQAGYSPNEESISRLLEHLAEEGPIDTDDAIKLAGDVVEEP